MSKKRTLSMRSIGGCNSDMAPSSTQECVGYKHASQQPKKRQRIKDFPRGRKRSSQSEIMIEKTIDSDSESSLETAAAANEHNSSPFSIIVLGDSPQQYDQEDEPHIADDSLPNSRTHQALLNKFRKLVEIIIKFDGARDENLISDIREMNSDQLLAIDLEKLGEHIERIINGNANQMKARIVEHFQKTLPKQHLEWIKNLK